MLPALTGAAYLHIGNRHYVNGARAMMQLFASTSPSYLTMCSLDLCNEFLSNSIGKRLEKAEKLMNRLRERIGTRYCTDYPSFDREPLHFTINAAQSGITGTSLAAELRKSGIECEFADDACVVLLFSPVDDVCEYERVAAALESAQCGPRVTPSRKICFPVPDKVLSIREAAFSLNEDIPVRSAAGRICACVNIPCPPAVPVVVSGELISEEAVSVMENYGIRTINAVITD
jgi:arginine/lysine/ornithine decarboxylase